MADKKFLYVLKEQDTDFYRIGITHNIKYRLGMLSGGNHRILDVIYCIEFEKAELALEAENSLHEMLREFTTDPKKRSWYDLSGDRFKLTEYFINRYVTNGVKEKLVLS